jgi:hypothetical protein
MFAVDGVPIFHTDMHGTPVLSGDVLSYLGQEPRVFVVKITPHGLDIPIDPADIALCEVIRYAES